MATTPSSPATQPQSPAAATEVASTPTAEAVVLQTTPEKKPVDTSIAAVAAADPIPVSGNVNLSTKEAILAKARQEAEALEASAAKAKAITAAPIVEVLKDASEAVKAGVAEAGVVGVGTGPVAPSAEVLAAIEADKAQLPVGTGTAGVVAELSTVGTGDAMASLRPDQPLDPTIRQVGPGAAAISTLKIEQVASEDKVKVTFPRKVVLTRKDYSRVEFPAGQSSIPVEYLEHPYLIASGMKVVPEVGKQTPVVVQTGTVAPVAPVK